MDQRSAATVDIDDIVDSINRTVNASTFNEYECNPTDEQFAVQQELADQIEQVMRTAAARAVTGYTPDADEGGGSW